MSAAVTVNAGAALLGSGPHAAADVIRGADTALYAAKTRGRNRVALEGDDHGHAAAPTAA